MKELKAGFTIEASVIVPLSMFVIVAFMYMTFYIHDSVIMASVGADYILENAQDYTGSTEEIAEDTKDMLECRLIIADDVSVSIEEDDGITLESSADFEFPMAFISTVLGFSQEEVSSSVNISMLDARSTLLKYKAIADGVETESE